MQRSASAAAGPAVGGGAVPVSRYVYGRSAPHCPLRGTRCFSLSAVARCLHSAGSSSRRCTSSSNHSSFRAPMTAAFLCPSLHLDRTPTTSAVRGEGGCSSIRRIQSGRCRVPFYFSRLRLPPPLPGTKTKGAAKISCPTALLRPNYGCVRLRGTATCDRRSERGHCTGGQCHQVQQKGRTPR